MNSAHICPKVVESWPDRVSQAVLCGHNQYIALYNISSVRPSASPGNPRGDIPFCTSCPLNTVSIVFRLLPTSKPRLFPRWLTKSGRFSVEEGIDTANLTCVANQWLRAQGSNPDNEDYCSNNCTNYCTSLVQ